jgi:signal transduction histidine kinase/HAMP domain-containing protein
MKISSKLKLAVYVPVIMALLILGALAYAYLDMRNIQQSGDTIRQIRSSITALNSFTFSYIFYHEDRPREQFLNEHDNLTRLIANARVSNAEQQQFLDNIRTDSVNMKALFQQLVTNYQLNGGAGTSGGKAAEDRLVGTLLLSSYDADSNASLLRNLVDDGIRISEIRTSLLIFLVIVVATVPLTFILLRTRKSILASLSNLNQSAGIIGSGNLEYKITETQDEIGDLAKSFNRMSSSLKTVTASKSDLEKEIVERQKAENEVRISRNFLEIANRHSGIRELLQDFVHETKSLSGCEAIGIRLLDESGHIPYAAYEGFSQKFYETESPLSIVSDQCMCINVIKGTTNPEMAFYTSHGSFYMNGTTKFLATVKEEDRGTTRNVCNATGYESVALIPIKLGARILGLVHLADHRENMVPLSIIRSLEEATSSLALSIQRATAEGVLQKYANNLEAANKELEAFAYSVSHDLRQPLRALDGFSLELVNELGGKLDETHKDYLNRIRKASQTMGDLIDDLLKLSRINRTEMCHNPVNLSDLANSIAEGLRKMQPERQAEFRIAPDLIVKGDQQLLSIALQNILGNAWKFSSKREQTLIEMGAIQINGESVYFIRDNGVGFEMQYSGKLFQPFQRLHSSKDYEGTGIGLATVQRVIQRHVGRVWAESEVDKGTTIYFTLGKE